MEGKFSVALSEKTGDEAIKEVSLKIKSVFPKNINAVLVFFTAHYQPLSILQTLKLSLRPQTIMGIQVPLLIYEDRIIKKGVLGCCINKEGTHFESILINKTTPDEIESAIRLALRDFPGEKKFSFAFIPPHFNPTAYLKAVELVMGKAFNLTGAGFIQKYATKHFQLSNELVGEGLLNIIGKGLEVTSIRIGGFVPVGKPFTITKVLSGRDVIMEIDNQPAIEIYKKYLEEKFDTFRKKRFFPLYPLGIKENNNYELLCITDYLDDGSLLCTGYPEENTRGNLMVLHFPSVLENLENILTPLVSGGEGILFVVNSLLRKKILLDAAEEEIKQIKRIVSNNLKVIGIYCDFAVFPDKHRHKIGMEAGSLSINLWK